MPYKETNSGRELQTNTTYLHSYLCSSGCQRPILIVSFTAGELKQLKEKWKPFQEQAVPEKKKQPQKDVYTVGLCIKYMSLWSHDMF